MDPLTIAAMVGVGFVALGTRWFVARFALFGTALEQLRKAKRRPIGEVTKDGERVRVAGTVRLIGESLSSPFGQRRCAAYRVRLIALEEHGPRQLVDETRHVPFRVEDETGVARVQVPDVRLVLSPRRVLDQEGGGHLDPELRVFLRDHELSASMGERVVVEQAVVLDGSDVAVLGTSQLMVDPSRSGRSYREPARELRLEELADGPVIVGAVE